MHDELNSELERHINEAISRRLSPRRSSLNLEEAELLGKYAREAAEDAGVPIVFSLLDACGQQRYFYSMDNALLISHSLAGKKAWSALALKMPTHKLAEQVQPGAPLYGLQNDPAICCFGGGLPCWSDGGLLGAIGISGGSVGEDIAIASSTLARFSREHFPLTAFNT